MSDLRTQVAIALRAWHTGLTDDWDQLFGPVKGKALAEADAVIKPLTAAGLAVVPAEQERIFKSIMANIPDALVAGYASRVAKIGKDGPNDYEDPWIERTVWSLARVLVNARDQWQAATARQGQFRSPVPHGPGGKGEGGR